MFIHIFRFCSFFFFFYYNNTNVFLSLAIFFLIRLNWNVARESRNSDSWKPVELNFYTGKTKPTKINWSQSIRCQVMSRLRNPIKIKVTFLVVLFPMQTQHISIHWYCQRCTQYINNNSTESEMKLFVKNQFRLHITRIICIYLLFNNNRNWTTQQIKQNWKRIKKQ